MQSANRRLPPLIAAGVLLLVAGAANASGTSREWLFQDEEDLFLRGCRLDRKCAVARHAKLLDFRRDHPEVYPSFFTVTDFSSNS